MAERKGFIFYESFQRAVEALPEEHQREMYAIILNYGLSGQEPAKGTNAFLLAVFEAVKAQIDANTARYEDGKKGGRPKKAKEETRVSENENIENQGFENENPRFLGEKPKEEVKEKEEDKEKEEVKENKGLMHGAAEAASAPEPAIRLILNDKTLHSVYQQEIDRWAELYPAVDVTQELRKMAGWLESNPSRRKTAKGINKFINGWLAREQDKGGHMPRDNGPPEAEKRINDPNCYSTEDSII